MTIGRAFATPFLWVRSFFPFTHDGRQTLIYISTALCAPALTLLIWWAMQQAASAAQWAEHERLATMVAAALLVIVIAHACFVSIRAIKIGPDGIEASGGPEDMTVTAAVGVKAGESE